MSVIGSPLIPAAEAPAEPAPPKAPARPRPLLWALLATSLLLASGGVRLWQDRRLAEAEARSEPAPFPLRELPTQVPGWHYQEGLGEERLDPEIARIAGSTDHVLRSYVDEATGVVVTILVIYGHGQNLSTHVPEVCYPNVGYKSRDTPLDRRIPLGRGSALFRALVYQKDTATGVDREEIYYSFRHEGQWYPDASVNWKQYRYNPSMIKVQVQRRLARQEKRMLQNPTEQFLAAFLPALEERLARAEAAGQAAAH